VAPARLPRRSAHDEPFARDLDEDAGAFELAGALNKAETESANVKAQASSSTSSQTDAYPTEQVAGMQATSGVRSFPLP
jgi:hypothetical protein